MGSVWARLLARRGDDLPPALARHAGVRRRIDTGVPLAEAELVVFDTELTGLDLKRDSIISIGAVRMRGGRIYPGRTFYRLLRPTAELKHQGVVVHGLRHADLEAAGEPQSVLADFLAFAGDAVLVGHFVHLDASFLHRALKTTFSAGLKSPSVDTVSIHDWLVDNDPAFARHHRGISLKKDLFTMAKRYGIAVATGHDALYDAYLTAQLLQRFLPFLDRSGVRRLKDLLSVGRA